MKHNNKTGSLLLENLLALLYITVVLLPFSHLYVKIFKTNMLLEKKEYESVLLENMAEYLENTEYQNIETKTGKRAFSSFKDFCSFFRLNCSTADEKKNFHINIDIQKTDYYYLNRNFEKLFIFKITADTKEIYYVPYLEDYEK
ncbi:hypothetical protein [Sebaldella sp. S0638]|uniref:hypothetical protein n=1 Tax=Sebaldella sp. S0638 TaxID=2957809 RepID=UPI00209DA4BC|nr:hypothetical protein [Sebaldella sp. S0638]MCP1226620.1 hypothetical protein [Sebaldella sp. S0638]